MAGTTADAAAAVAVGASRRTIPEETRHLPRRFLVVHAGRVGGPGRRRRPPSR
ncbi:MAG: hypothetical protein OSA99_10405 [Acidimicrobiales bacterium]|nr:hypothetical protein [Acidimicrobiales bacterium]